MSPHYYLYGIANQHEFIHSSDKDNILVYYVMNSIKDAQGFISQLMQDTFFAWVVGLPKTKATVLLWGFQNGGRESVCVKHTVNKIKTNFNLPCIYFIDFFKNGLRASSVALIITQQTTVKKVI